jgi:hypothetical protein
MFDLELDKGVLAFDINIIVLCGLGREGKGQRQ